MIFPQAWRFGGESSILTRGENLRFSPKDDCREGRTRSGIDSGWACTSKEKEDANNSD
jgi:hypothetical protein